jgi:hypothetical protein
MTRFAIGAFCLALMLLAGCVQQRGTDPPERPIGPAYDNGDHGGGGGDGGGGGGSM